MPYLGPFQNLGPSAPGGMGLGPVAGSMGGGSSFGSPASAGGAPGAASGGFGNIFASAAGNARSLFGQAMNPTSNLVPPNSFTPETANLIAGQGREAASAVYGGQARRLQELLNTGRIGQGQDASMMQELNRNAAGEMSGATREPAIEQAKFGADYGLRAASIAEEERSRNIQAYTSLMAQLLRDSQHMQLSGGGGGRGGYPGMGPDAGGGPGAGAFAIR